MIAEEAGHIHVSLCGLIRGRAQLKSFEGLPDSVSVCLSFPPRRLASLSVRVCVCVVGGGFLLPVFF